MAQAIDVIIEGIQVRLETIGVTSARDSVWRSQVHFAVAEDPYTIYCGRHSARIYDAQSLYGEYLYADPDFYTRLVKMVRMIVNPTSIWHISQIGSSIGMPRILDE